MSAVVSNYDRCSSDWFALFLKTPPVSFKQSALVSSAVRLFSLPFLLSVEVSSVYSGVLPFLKFLVPREWCALSNQEQHLWNETRI